MSTKVESKDNVKIIFPLVRDEDDFPPFDEELMWAIRVGPDKYKINQVPFFAVGVSDGDVVVAKYREKGLYFESTDTKSGNKTIQVICHDEDLPPHVIALMEELGCEVELSEFPFLFAVNIPLTVNFFEIYNRVADYIDEERMEFYFTDPEGGIDIFGLTTTS